ncbi:hypothetical protein I7I48_04498 [Histoplasma ohiense]|nr:hypothetical protein I7I48_04498 [Histoplasma ohiense (nom. inval.)]
MEQQHSYTSSPTNAASVPVPPNPTPLLCSIFVVCVGRSEGTICSFHSLWSDPHSERESLTGEKKHGKY